MYVRFQHDHEFQALGLLLNPHATEADFEYNVENVYQWMYVSLAKFDTVLNISRDHGWSDLPEEIEQQYDVDDPRLLALIRPGPTYATSSGRAEPTVPEHLWYDIAQYIADRLGCSVDVLPGALNVDVPDADPVATLTPQVANGG
jgi:hypothetical protein